MADSSLASHDHKLKEVLQSYRLFAMNDLRGPASASSLLLNAEIAKLAAASQLHLGDKYAFNNILESLQHSGLKLPSPLTPSHADSTPYVLKADSKYVLTEAIIEGQVIASLEIGGEKRLCLPQIFKTVLSGFSLEHIHNACDKLIIYCARCNDEQLDLLKRTGNLPSHAQTCGLIRLTDAERLCTDLLYNASDSLNNNNNSSSYVSEDGDGILIPVYHEVFGYGKGILNPLLYTSPDRKCIRCEDCGNLFTTRRFIGHSHRGQENGVHHWGFNRDNWRSYLLLDEDSATDQLETLFQDLLNKFTPDGISSPSTLVCKRKAEPVCAERSKERRFSDTPVHSSPAKAIRQKLPTQKSCPPMLEHPEKVIPSCQTSKYEKHFVPNVALQQLTNEKESYENKKEVKISRVTSHDDGISCQSPTESADTATMVMLDKLRVMEHMYNELLRECTHLSNGERHLLEHKHTACSESIREQLSHLQSRMDVTEDVGS